MSLIIFSKLTGEDNEIVSCICRVRLWEDHKCEAKEYTEGFHETKQNNIKTLGSMNRICTFVKSSSETYA